MSLRHIASAASGAVRPWSTFSLSDPITEDAIYDSYAMRKFTGINFIIETVPDETTLCHMMKGGTIVDATIINAPCSTENAKKARNPEIQNGAHLSAIDYRMNRRPGILPEMADCAIDWERLIEHRKSSVRCKVANAFRIIKCRFGCAKTRYRGLKKIENRLYAIFARGNFCVLAMAERRLREV